MFSKLKNVFAPTHKEPKAVAPFEVLVPEGRTFSEEPKLAARVMSLLFASADDVNTIEFEGRRAISNNSALREFLGLVAGAKQLDNLIAQCKSIMFAPTQAGELGKFCCTSEGRLFEFSFFELSPPPGLKWEVRRVIHGA